MQNRTLLKRIVEERYTYLFLLPILVFFAVFTLRSLIVVGQFSLFEFTGTGRIDRFIGLTNYREVIADPYFWNAFRNTFVFMLGVVPGQLGIGLMLALLLNRRGQVSTVYRTIYFLPVVTTTAIIGMISPLLFSPVNGPINVALQALLVIDGPRDFLGNRDTALQTVIFVSIWKHAGMYMAYWLAALQTIPDELYEAATVAGASSRQKLWHITLPLLIPIGSIITLLCVIGSLKPFALVKTMTNGGPFFASDVVMTYIYRFAFSSEAGPPRIGYASAAAVFYGVVLIGLAAVQTLISRRINAGRRHSTVGAGAPSTGVTTT